MGSVKAAVPCDDLPPRRTSTWNEPGHKAKEWGTERPWSGWESGAGAGTLCSIESSPHQVLSRFRAHGFVVRPSPGPCSLFAQWTERVPACVWHVCGRGGPVVGREGAVLLFLP